MPITDKDTAEAASPATPDVTPSNAVTPTNVLGVTPVDTETADRLRNEQATQNPLPADPILTLSGDAVVGLAEYLPMKEVLRLRELDTVTKAAIERYIQSLVSGQTRILNPLDKFSVVPKNTPLPAVIDALRQRKMVRKLIVFDADDSIDIWDATIRVVIRIREQVDKLPRADIFLMRNVQSSLNTAKPDEADLLRLQLHVFIKYCLEKGLFRKSPGYEGRELQDRNTDPDKILTSWSDGHIYYDIRKSGI
jgi:hypothetical protein